MARRAFRQQNNTYLKAHTDNTVYYVFIGTFTKKMEAGILVNEDRHCAKY